MSLYDLNSINNGYNQSQQIQQLSSITNRNDNSKNTSTTSEKDIAKISAEEAEVEGILREQNIEVTRKNKAIALALYYQGQAINAETIAYTEKMMEQYKINNQLSIEAFLLLFTNSLEITDERIEAVHEIIENKNFVSDIKQLSEKIDEFNQYVEIMVENGTLENVSIEKNIIVENVDEKSFDNKVEVRKEVVKDKSVNNELDNKINSSIKDKAYLNESVIEHKQKEIIVNKNSEQQNITLQNKEENIGLKINVNQKSASMSESVARDNVIKTDTTFKTEQKFEFKKINQEIFKIINSLTNNPEKNNDTNNLNIKNIFSSDEFFENIKLSDSVVRNTGISDEAKAILQEYKNSKTENPEIKIIDNKPVLLISEKGEPKLIDIDDSTVTNDIDLKNEISKPVLVNIGGITKLATINKSDIKILQVDLNIKDDIINLINPKSAKKTIIEGKEVIVFDNQNIKLADNSKNKVSSVPEIKNDLSENKIEKNIEIKSTVNGEKFITLKSDNKNTFYIPLEKNGLFKNNEKVSGLPKQEPNIRLNSDSTKILIKSNNKEITIPLDTKLVQSSKTITSSPVVVNVDNRPSIIFKDGNVVKQLEINPENTGFPPNELNQPEVINSEGTNLLIVKDTNGDKKSVILDKNLLAKADILNIDKPIIVQANNVSNILYKEPNKQVKLAPVSQFINIENSPVNSALLPVLENLDFPENTNQAKVIFKDGKINVIDNKGFSDSIPLNKILEHAETGIDKFKNFISDNSLKIKPENKANDSLKILPEIKLNNDSTKILINSDNKEISIPLDTKSVRSSETITSSPRVINIENKPSIIFKDGNVVKQLEINPQSTNLLPEELNEPEIIDSEGRKILLLKSSDNNYKSIPLDKELLNKAEILDTEKPVIIEINNTKSLLYKETNNQVKVAPLSNFFNEQNINDNNLLADLNFTPQKELVEDTKTVPLFFNKIDDQPVMSLKGKDNTLNVIHLSEEINIPKEALVLDEHLLVDKNTNPKVLSVDNNLLNISSINTDILGEILGETKPDIQNIINLDAKPQLVVKNKEGKSFAFELNNLVNTDKREKINSLVINNSNELQLIISDPSDNKFKFIPIENNLSQSLKNSEQIINQFKTDLNDFNTQVQEVLKPDNINNPLKNEKLDNLLRTTLKENEPTLFSLNGKEVLLTKNNDNKISVVNIDNLGKVTNNPFKIKIDQQGFFVLPNQDKNVFIPSLLVSNSLSEDINKIFKSNINGQENIIIHDPLNNNENSFIKVDKIKPQNFVPETNIISVENNQGKPAIFLSDKSIGEKLISLPENNNENYYDLEKPIIINNKIIVKDTNNTLRALDISDISKNGISLNKSFVADTTDKNSKNEIIGNKSLFIKNDDNKFVQYKIDENTLENNPDSVKTLNINGKSNLLFTDKKTDVLKALAFDDIPSKLLNVTKTDKPFIFNSPDNQKNIVFTNNSGELKTIPINNLIGESIDLENPIMANINGKESLLIKDEKNDYIKAIPVSPVSNKNFEKITNPVQINIDGKNNLIVNDKGINKIIPFEAIMQTEPAILDTKIKVKIEGKSFFVIPENTNGEHLLVPEKSGIMRDLPDIANPLKIDFEGKTKFIIKDDKNQLRIIPENDIAKINNYDELKDPVPFELNGKKLFIIPGEKEIIKVNIDANILKNSLELKTPVEINLNNKTHLLVPDNDKNNLIVDPEALTAEEFNIDGESFVTNINDKEQIVLINPDTKKLNIIPVDSLAKISKTIEDVHEFSSENESMVIIKGENGKFTIKPKTEILTNAEDITTPIIIGSDKKESIIIPDKSGLILTNIQNITKKPEAKISNLIARKEDGTIQIVFQDKNTGKHKVFNTDLNQLKGFEQKNLTFSIRDNDKSKFVFPDGNTLKAISLSNSDIAKQNPINQSISINENQSIIIDDKKAVFIDLNNIPDSNKFNFDKPAQVSIDGENYLLINDKEKNGLKILPVESEVLKTYDFDSAQVQSLSMIETDILTPASNIISNKNEIIDPLEKNISEPLNDKKIKNNFTGEINKQQTGQTIIKDERFVIPETFEQKVILLKQMLGLQNIQLEKDNKPEENDKNSISEEIINEPKGLLGEILNEGINKANRSGKENTTDDLKVSFDSLLNSILSDPKSKDLMVESISDIVFFKQVFEEEKAMLKNPETNEANLVTIKPEAKKDFTPEERVIIAQTFAGQSALIFNNDNEEPKLIKLDEDSDNIHDFDTPVKSNDGKVIFSDKQSGLLKSFNTNSLLQTNLNKIPKNFISKKDNTLIIKNDNQFLEVDIKPQFSENENYTVKPKFVNIEGKNNILVQDAKKGTINFIPVENTIKEPVKELLQVNLDNKPSLVFNKDGINKLINIDLIPESYLSDIKPELDLRMDGVKVSPTLNQKSGKIVISGLKTGNDVFYNSEQPLKLSLNNEPVYIIKDNNSLKIISENKLNELKAENLRDPVETDISGNKFIIFPEKNTLNKIKINETKPDDFSNNLDEPIEIDNKFILFPHKDKNITKNILLDKNDLIKKSNHIKEPVNLNIDNHEYMAVPNGRSTKLLDYKNILLKAENIESPIFIDNRKAENLSDKTKIIIQNNNDKAKIIDIEPQLLEAKSPLNEPVIIRAEKNTKIIIPETNGLKQVNFDNQELLENKVPTDKPLIVKVDNQEKILLNNDGENILIDINKLKDFDKLYKNIIPEELKIGENLETDSDSQLNALTTEKKIDLVREVLGITNSKQFTSIDKKDNENNLEIDNESVNFEQEDNPLIIKPLINTKQGKDNSVKMSFDSLLNSILSDPKAKDLIVEKIVKPDFIKRSIEDEDNKSQPLNKFSNNKSIIDLKIIKNLINNGIIAKQDIKTLTSGEKVLIDNSLFTINKNQKTNTFNLTDNKASKSFNINPEQLIKVNYDKSDGYIFKLPESSNLSFIKETDMNINLLVQDKSMISKNTFVMDNNSSANIEIENIPDRPKIISNNSNQTLVVTKDNEEIFIDLDKLKDFEQLYKTKNFSNISPEKLNENTGNKSQDLAKENHSVISQKVSLIRQILGIEQNTIKENSITELSDDINKIDNETFIDSGIAKDSSYKKINVSGKSEDSKMSFDSLLNSILSDPKAKDLIVEKITKPDFLKGNIEEEEDNFIEKPIINSEVPRNISASGIKNIDIKTLKGLIDTNSIPKTDIKIINSGEKVAINNSIFTLNKNLQKNALNLINDKTFKPLSIDSQQPIMANYNNSQGYIFKSSDNKNLSFISEVNLERISKNTNIDISSDRKINDLPRIINHQGSEKISVVRNDEEILIDLSKLKDFERLYNPVSNTFNMDISKHSEDNNSVTEKKVELLRQVLGIDNSLIKETFYESDEKVNDNNIEKDHEGIAGLLGLITENKRTPAKKNVAINDEKISFESLLNSVLSEPDAKKLLVEEVKNISFFKQVFEEEKLLIKNPEENSYKMFPVKPEKEKIKNDHKVSPDSIDNKDNSEHVTIDNRDYLFDKKTGKKLEQPIKINHENKEKILITNNGKSIFIDVKKLESLNNEFSKLPEQTEQKNPEDNTLKNKVPGTISSQEINLIKNDVNKMNDVLKNFLDNDILYKPTDFSNQINMMSQMFGVFENKVKTIKEELEPFKNEDSEESLENPFGDLIKKITSRTSTGKNNKPDSKKDNHNTKLSFDKLLNSVLSEISARVEKVSLNLQGREILSNNEKCFCIPLSIPFGELKFNGEILIKEDRDRNVKSSGGKVLSITLSVQTKTLNTVLIDFVNIDKDLQISLKVDNKKVKEIFDKKISMLNDMMKNSSYRVNPVTCIVNPNKNRGNSLLVPRNTFPKSLKRIDGII